MPAFDRRIRDFQAANTQVLGISTDSPFSHDNWAKSVGISNYPLLSDIHRTVAKDYGVYWPDWNSNRRATFIVDKQGTIRFIERYGTGELPEPDKILAEVKILGQEASLRAIGARVVRATPASTSSVPATCHMVMRSPRRIGASTIPTIG